MAGDHGEEGGKGSLCSGGRGYRPPHRPFGGQTPTHGIEGEQGQEGEGAVVEFVRGKVGTVHGITSLQVKHLHMAGREPRGKRALLTVVRKQTCCYCSSRQPSVHLHLPRHRPRRRPYTPTPLPPHLDAAAAAPGRKVAAAGFDVELYALVCTAGVALQAVHLTCSVQGQTHQHSLPLR